MTDKVICMWAKCLLWIWVIHKKIRSRQMGYRSLIVTWSEISFAYLNKHMANYPKHMADYHGSLQCHYHKPMAYYHKHMDHYHNQIHGAIYNERLLHCVKIRERKHLSEKKSEKCISLPTIIRTPPINAQCRSKSWHWSEMPLNADHRRSIPLNADQCRLRGIDRNWSTLGSMPEFWSTLIGIGHWSGESCIIYSTHTLT